MTRQPDIQSKTDRAVYSPSSIEGKQKVRDFKTLCRQDGISANHLLEEALDLLFKKHHWPPGNPQLLLERFQEDKPAVVPNCKCGRPAVTHGLHLSSRREFDFCIKCFSGVPQRYDRKVWSFQPVAAVGTKGEPY